MLWDCGTKRGGISTATCTRILGNMNHELSSFTLSTIQQLPPIDVTLYS